MIFLTKITSRERQNFCLWIPIFFGFGAAFYFKFFAVFPFLFLGGLVLFAFSRSFILLACLSFLLGGFYAKFYEKPPELKAKIFVDVVGKVVAVKKFTNPVNHLEGANLVVSELSLKKIESFKKKETKIRKTKAKKKKSSPHKAKSKKTSKHNNRPRNKCGVTPLGSAPTILKSAPPTCHPALVAGSTCCARQKIENTKNIKELINLADYQEVDREFLDRINAYQNDLPQNLEKVSVNLVKGVEGIEVNDKIAFRALLEPPKSKEFPNSFDYQLDAKLKKIAAYGFVSGAVTILEKSKVSNSNEWFLTLREKIRTQIFNSLNGDEAAIAVAFLIGDQKQISPDLAAKIRNSGLSHLLSISGFHLSLAGAIFFLSIRFLLSRSEGLTLNFDLKKIASLLAIFAVYFYLKLADSPLPAQRAFIFVAFALFALFLSEKLDAKRATMCGILLLILLNPYVIFSVSFQLSFAAILVLVSFSTSNRNYFLQILLLSILVQIATIPFLMHHFRSLSLLGFIANLAAIPLASFLIMPLGFLALFLMPLGLEKPALLLMNYGILALEKIADFITALPYSYLTSPWLPSSGLILAIIGLLLICLNKSALRLFGMIIFALSFLTIFSVKKPKLIFEQEQKFFAIYDGKNLFFSEKLRASKQRQYWMDQFDEKTFRVLSCAKNFCELTVQNRKILVLTKRNKISEICKKDFDVIVNLTRKYQLPHCINNTKIKIDNQDFYQRGTQFLFFENEEFSAEKIDNRRKTQRNNESNFGHDAQQTDGDSQDDGADHKGGEIENQILGQM